VIVLHAFPVGGASVTYSLGGTSITRAMARNGKALTIVAGASKTVKVVVKVGDNTAVGKVLKVRTFGYSFNTADAEDLVLAAITVKR
jgi:hypothetical protein